jgi:hypothetical protein
MLEWMSKSVVDVLAMVVEKATGYMLRNTRTPPDIVSQKEQHCQLHPTLADWAPEDLADLVRVLPTKEKVHDLYQGATTSKLDLTWVLQEALALRFVQARRRLLKTRSVELVEPRIAFHGTGAFAAASIARIGLIAAGQIHPETGFRLYSANGSAYGKGIYLAPHLHTALSYSRSCNVSHVFVCLVLRGLSSYASYYGETENCLSAGYDSHTSSCNTMWILPKSDLVLPVYLVRTNSNDYDSTPPPPFIVDNCWTAQGNAQPISIRQAQGRGQHKRYQIGTGVWYSRKNLARMPQGRAALEQFELEL